MPISRILTTAISRALLPISLNTLYSYFMRLLAILSLLLIGTFAVMPCAHAVADHHDADVTCASEDCAPHPVDHQECGDCAPAFCGDSSEWVTWSSSVAVPCLTFSTVYKINSDTVSWQPRADFRHLANHSHSLMSSIRLLV